MSITSAPWSLRDRVLSKRGAAALTHPAATLAAGVGAATLIVVGAPVFAPVAALGAWAAVAWSQLPRRPDEGPSVDVSRLPQPWRDLVAEIVDGHARLAEQVTRTAPGPLRERLGQIVSRMSDAVVDAGRIGDHGARIDAALATLPQTVVLQRQLHDAQLEGADMRADAVAAQLSSVARLTVASRDARDRLRLLDARVDETVARMVELALNSTSTDGLGGLGDDVDAIASELESLRSALDEV